MKKKILMLALMIGLISCENKEKSTEEKTTVPDKVEVVYFHGKHRCATCLAIEKNTAEVLNSIFADELKNGKVAFKIVDISTPEGEKMADIYEVTWSSLFVNKWKNGIETRKNITEFAFGNARTNPEAYKTGLAGKIRESLK